MDTKNHPNSHLVRVHRAPMFAADAQNSELEEMYADAYRGVGSYFTKGSTRTATGLTFGEEAILMPEIIQIPTTDKDFRQQVNTFFQNIDSKIPAHKKGDLENGGLELEIGLENGNDKPVSAENMPLNVEQYVRYRQIIGHPQVAESEAAGKGNRLKLFFVYDPKAVSKSTININEQRDEALTKYLEIKANKRMVRMYLTLMGKDTRRVKLGEETTELRKLVDSKPSDFITLVKDRNKEMKYIIEDAINNRVLERVGERIVTADDAVEIGHDMKSAILYLSDARNTKSYAMIKARLQEVWKKQSISVDTEEDLDTPPVVVITPETQGIVEPKVPAVAPPAEKDAFDDDDEEPTA